MRQLSTSFTGLYFILLWSEMPSGIMFQVTVKPGLSVGDRASPNGSGGERAGQDLEAVWRECSSVG